MVQPSFSSFSWTLWECGRLWPSGQSINDLNWWVRLTVEGGIVIYSCCNSWWLGFSQRFLHSRTNQPKSLTSGSQRNSFLYDGNFKGTTGDSLTLTPGFASFPHPRVLSMAWVRHLLSQSCSTCSSVCGKSVLRCLFDLNTWGSLSDQCRNSWWSVCCLLNVKRESKIVQCLV